MPLGEPGGIVSATLSQGSLTQTTAPTIDPVTVADCKKQMNLDHTDDDAFIEGLITVATQWAQTFTNRQFINATYTLKMAGFPEEILVPRAPLSSVTSITYTDSAGDSQTLATTEYETNTASLPGRIRPAYGKYWPATRLVYNAVVLTFVAGYGATAATVPVGIRQAIKAAVANLYEHRESVVTGLTVDRIPEVVERLLWPYRMMLI